MAGGGTGGEGKGNGTRDDADDDNPTLLNANDDAPDVFVLLRFASSDAGKDDDDEETKDERTDGDDDDDDDDGIDDDILGGNADEDHAPRLKFVDGDETVASNLFVGLVTSSACCFSFELWTGVVLLAEVDVDVDIDGADA